MRQTPTPEHLHGCRETEALIADLLKIRDREAMEAALRYQLASCVGWQKNLRRWLQLSRGPDASWHGVTFGDAENLLKLLEEEEEDIRQALLDLLAEPTRPLTSEESATLNLYDGHKYPEPPPPKHPDLAEPGSAEKIKLLSERLASGKGLWHPSDAPLEPTDSVAYLPRHARGNFATIGRDTILLFLINNPDEKDHS